MFPLLAGATTFVLLALYCQWIGDDWEEERVEDRSATRLALLLNSKRRNRSRSLFGPRQRSSEHIEICEFPSAAHPLSEQSPVPHRK